MRTDEVGRQRTATAAETAAFERTLAARVARSRDDEGRPATYRHRTRPLEVVTAWRNTSEREIPVLPGPRRHVVQQARPGMWIVCREMSEPVLDREGNPVVDGMGVPRRRPVTEQWVLEDGAFRATYERVGETPF